MAQRKVCNKTFAVKTIEKAKIIGDEKALVSLKREISIMRRVEHEGIIKLYENQGIKLSGSTLISFSNKKTI